MKLLYRPRIISNHESHAPIRLLKVPFKAGVNFGNSEIKHTTGIVINPPSSIALNRNKLFMKSLYVNNDIPSFLYFREPYTIHEKYFPIVIKHNEHLKMFPHLQRVKNMEELCATMKNKDVENFHFEKFYPYNKEYRIHVSAYNKNEVFATEKIPNYGGWVRNLKSCTFKKDFDKPKQWKEMLSSCRKVLNIIGMDIGGFDVAYNSHTEQYWIIECNSACGMGGNTRKAYEKELNRIVWFKFFGL